MARLKPSNNFRKIAYQEVRWSYLHIIVVVFSLLLASCTSNDIVDSNISVENNNWTYPKTAKSVIEITDTVKTYSVYFKLRHTANYRYANIYTIFRLKGKGVNKKVRYQFKLAKPDGQWLGKGSGDLYTYQFALLKDFQFPAKGKYELEMEQNMRDNPLTGISDVGLKVVKNE